MQTEEMGRPLSYVELTTPPKLSQDKERRIWFRDKRDKITAITLLSSEKKKADIPQWLTT